MKKIRIIPAAFFLLFMILSAAQAKTTTLPSSLTVISNEAFRGDTKIDGIIKIPNSVKTVGTSAFSGTHVYALDFASGVASIGDQNLSNGYTAYVIVRGNNTTVYSTAFNYVKYVFANAGSNAYYRAVSDGIAFVPLSQLYKHNNFYYQLANGTATLLCAVDPELIPASVTIPETVNGCRVTALGPHAFFRCSQIKTLKVPHGVTKSTSTFSGCPSATITYYGAPVISSISCNRTFTENECGQKIIWTAHCTGGSGSLTFTWEVMYNGQVLKTKETSTNTFSAYYDTHNLSDVISVRVTVTDERGNSDTKTGGDITLYALGGPIPGRTYRCLIISNSFPGYGADMYRPSFGNSAKQFRSMLKTMTKTPYQITLKEERTASQILSDISSAFAGADSNDVSLFVLLTHGDSTGGLCGSDEWSRVSVKQLRSKLDTIPGRKVVILDACYSGKHIGKSAEKANSASLTESELQAINNNVISSFYSPVSKADNLASDGYIVITAATGNEFSWSYDNGSGTFMFIEMLRGCGWIMNTGSGYASSSYPADANNNRLFTHNEIYTYTRNRVENQHTGQQDGISYKQHVQAYPSQSNYLMFAK